MNSLASLGIILIFALLAGHLAKFVRVPEVTGSMIAGEAVGPSFLGWITNDSLSSLEVFSEAALGLILFSIGSVFEVSRFRTIGKRAMLITVAESALAGILVFTGMRLVGQPWTVSLLLGANSMETAMASTLMVMRECNSQGVLTEMLTGVIALNKICFLICFSLAPAVIDLTSSTGSSLGGMLHESLFPWHGSSSVR